MAAVSRPARDRLETWFRTGLAAVATVVMFAVLVACNEFDVRQDGDSTRGSGVSVTELRRVTSFATVELAGANTVTVRVGPPQSVAVTADDNLVDHVSTTVRDGRLLISDDGSFTSRTPMTVAVSVPALDGVTLSGEGTVAIDGVAATDFIATLSGTGTLTASGSVDRLTAVLTADGTIELQGLAAQDVIARLEGTGTISLRATSTLDATLTGTGSIVYSGSPSVTAHNTGTGSITGH
jgi:hypothetical protein